MLPLIRQLYDIITNNDSACKTIQIIQSIGSEESGFVVESTRNLLEIGFTKKVYIALFLEAHTYWHKALGGCSPDISQQSVTEIYNTYFMTLGMLLTTNENHSVLRLHDQIIMSLAMTDQGFYRRDFDILTTYLSSRLKRINKSPLLWHLTKKMLVNLLFDQEDPHGLNATSTFLVDRIFLSCKHHFANYYATAFLQWLIHLLAVLQFEPLLNLIETNLVSACKSSVLDVSLWTCLASYARALREPEFYPYEQYRILGGTMMPPALTMAEDRDAAFISVQIQWLLRAECSILMPYQVLIDAFDGRQIPKTIVDAFDDVITMEPPHRNTAFSLAVTAVSSLKMAGHPKLATSNTS